MNITLTRIDGAIWVSPAPPYLTGYLQYSHRLMGREGWRMVTKFEKRLLHTAHPDGGVITFQGFFDRIAGLIAKNGDTMVLADLRTPVDGPDLEAVRNINWEAIGSTGPRDYQLNPLVEFLYKAKEGSGIVNATGGKLLTLPAARRCTMHGQGAV